MFLGYILPSADSNFFSPFLYSWEAHGMCLYSEMTLKIFDNCYAQMQTNQGLVVLRLGLGGPCIWTMGKLGVIGGEGDA